MPPEPVQFVSSPSSSSRDNACRPQLHHSLDRTLLACVWLQARKPVASQQGSQKGWLSSTQSAELQQVLPSHEDVVLAACVGGGASELEPSRKSIESGLDGVPPVLLGLLPIPSLQAVRAAAAARTMAAQHVLVARAALHEYITALLALASSTKPWGRCASRPGAGDSGGSPGPLLSGVVCTNFGCTPCSPQVKEFVARETPQLHRNRVQVRRVNRLRKGHSDHFCVRMSFWGGCLILDLQLRPVRIEPSCADHTLPPAGIRHAPAAHQLRQRRARTYAEALRAPQPTPDWSMETEYVDTQGALEEALRGRIRGKAVGALYPFSLV